MEGALGDGEGKWRLTVSSDAPVAAMSRLHGRAGAGGSDARRLNADFGIALTVCCSMVTPPRFFVTIEVGSKAEGLKGAERRDAIR